MAGKRKQTHWTERRKNKQARGDAGDNGNNNNTRARKNENVDRRAGLSDTVHPGSYAAQYKAERAAAAADTSATADSTAVAAAAQAPKRRYGLWLAFCGKNYSGMQMNEGVKTIEAEVERALFEAGAIAEINYGFLQKIGWSRAARTDKGVHAAGQLVTAKLRIGDDIPAFMATVNSKLPSDIRVTHIVSVTNTFNAKLACDQRTYEYLAPTFIFHKRTRSAPATHASSAVAANNNNDHDDDEARLAAIEITPETLAQHQAFRLDATTLATLQRVLRQFEGTHNFHNFTSKLEPTSPKCKRYITSFTTDAPFVAHNMEWIRLRVVGQSFLLHQIRKMIGTALEIVAGVADADVIDRATQLDKMDLPKAPSVGLYLAQAHFKIYNLKMRDLIQTPHPPLALDDADVAATVEAFKRDHIFKHIIEHEEATRTYAKWLRTLELLPFDYTTTTFSDWKIEKEALANATDRVAKRQALQQLRAAPDAATAASAATAVAAAMGAGEK